jgi:subtilisin family serine protease
MPSRSASGLSSQAFDVPSIPDYVIVELRYDSQVVLPGVARAFAGPAAAEPARDALNEVLEQFAVKRVAPLFDLKKKDFTRRTAEAVAVPAMAAPDPTFALAGFVEVVPKDSRQAPAIAERLNQTPGVWKAYVAPRPEPAAKRRTRRKAAGKAAPPAPAPTGTARGSRNFEPAQGYLYDAPDGIGAAEAWLRRGGTGKGVTLCDIEGAWKLDHEDLPTGIKLIGGTMIDDVGWRDHGTAVLGEMVSQRGNIGCVGISYDAKAVVHSAVIDGVFNAAGAIAGAAATLKAGDVILIELHAIGGPNGKYLAMQYWDPVFAAIRTATAKGIVVVEAAGNGDENFDLPAFADTGLQKDAGAIVVGAGVPPTNYFDAYDFFGMFPPYSRIGAPRSRIWFSNYGRIVNVQGWGWHVTTLGYGDAQGGADEKLWYTHRFSGTSSASPIVTGAVACIQGFAKARLGRPLTPSEVRDILENTGTPQIDDAPRAPLAQKIGPLPNLAVALTEIENRFGQ